MKSGMALERAHIGRKQAEADRAGAITVIDPKSGSWGLR